MADNRLIKSFRNYAVYSYGQKNIKMINCNTLHYVQSGTKSGQVSEFGTI